MRASHELPNGWRFEVVAEIGSTNAEVLQRAGQGEAEGLALRAGRQTNGRGRRGRAWASPKGNLYLSILVNAPLLTAGQVGFAAALAICDAIETEFSGDTSRLTCKWPNDLVLDGAKVAGLLLEAVPDREQVVVGLGVNVVPTEVKDALHPVGSLGSVGISVELDNLAINVCTALALWLKTWRTVGFAPIRKAWLDRAQGLHQPIVVKLPTEAIEGTFYGLSEDGALMLNQVGRAVRLIKAGDVFFASGGES